MGGDQGIEPWTSSSQRKNHTPRLIARNTVSFFVAADGLSCAREMETSGAGDARDGPLASCPTPSTSARRRYWLAGILLVFGSGDSAVEASDVARGARHRTAT